MATLILNNNSLGVSLESDHLVIRQYNRDNQMETLPIKDIDRVLVVGAPALTFPVLARLMDRRIPCSFVTKGGRYRGSLNTDGHANVARRMLQYDRLRDSSFCLPLARELIRAKLRNCRRVIQRLCANRGVPVTDMGEHWTELNASLSSLNSADGIEAIRGVEGIGTFHYFRILSDYFPTEFPFVSRSRQPPLDEANAMLSFVYMVLMNEMLAFVRLHALDPGLGFVHGDRSQAPSLALDLMEPFRPGFADLQVVNLLSHGRLNAKRDFRRDPQTGGVYLDGDARGRVLSACETSLSRRFTSCNTATHTTLRLEMDLQVMAFVRCLESCDTPTFFRLP